MTEIPVRKAHDDESARALKKLGFKPEVQLGKVEDKTTGKMLWRFTEDYVRRVLAVVDAGLTYGKGNPIPGHMCVEAAVAFASNERHTDEPMCVNEELHSYEIALNDMTDWHSPATRAEGLRRVAVAQLGSDGVFDHQRFKRFVSQHYVKLVLEHMVAPKLYDEQSVSMFFRCTLFKPVPTSVYGRHGLWESNLSARAESMWLAALQHATASYQPGIAKYTLDYVNNELPSGKKLFKTNDERNAMIAEVMVQACIEQNLPGTKFLYLTEGSQTRAAVRAKLRRRNPKAAKLAAAQRKASKRAAKHK